MELLWVANAVLLLVVAPILLLVAGRVVRHLWAVSKLADSTLANGLALSKELEAVPTLVETKRLTGAARQLVGRYGTALAALL
jgi:hypothetical protein